MSSPFTVPGSLPWTSWNAPPVIVAATVLEPPPTQLGTVLKNFFAFTGIGGVVGAAAGMVLLGTGLAGAIIPAAVGANIGALYGVLEGTFLSGRDERRFAAATEQHAAAVAAAEPAASAAPPKRKRVVVKPPAVPSGARTRESDKH